jgi:hypothetical protein
MVNVVGSILDSGSGRHINSKVTVDNPDNAMPLRGFNNSISWTLGSGCLPIQLKDEISGEQVSMKVDDVDKLDSSNEPILSLGKLLKLGFNFHFVDFGKSCVAMSPDGKMKFNVSLGSDDVLRLEHSTKS